MSSRYPTVSRVALRVSIIYALAGIGWILGSDFLIDLLLDDPAALATAQTLKGIAFIAFTAGLLFVLMRSGMQRVRDVEIETSNRLRLVLNTIPTRVFWKDRDLRYQGANAAFLNDAGVALSELPGLSERDMPWGLAAAEIEDDDRRVLQRGVPSLDREVQVKGPSGQALWLQISKVPILDHDQQVTGLLVAYEDVTDRRKTEAELRQALKMQVLGEVTGGVAHDFKNVLAVILANGELLRDAVKQDPEARPLVDDILMAAKSAAGMVRKLLGFGRRGELQIAPLELEPVVTEMARLTGRLLGAQYRIIVRNDGSLADANGDPDAIEQILLNLLTNARDAMPHGGDITITLRTVPIEDPPTGDERHPDRVRAGSASTRPGAFVAVEVHDQGTGIPPDVMTHILEPYHTTKAPGAGTGLGLRMVTGLVHQHDGFMEVASDGVHGSTVTFFLPVATETPVDVAAPEPTPLRGGNEVILVVDDQESLRRTAGRILTRFGYRVLEAGNGAEALTVLRSAPRVQLVLSDFQMPELTGADLLAQMRQEGFRQPFILSSGIGELQEAGLREGSGLHVLPKPWLLEDLVRTVREVLDRPRTSH